MIYTFMLHFLFKRWRSLIKNLINFPLFTFSWINSVPNSSIAQHGILYVWHYLVFRARRSFYSEISSCCDLQWIDLLLLQASSAIRHCLRTWTHRNHKSPPSNAMVYEVSWNAWFTFVQSHRENFHRELFLPSNHCLLVLRLSIVDRSRAKYDTRWFDFYNAWIDRWIHARMANVQLYLVSI